MPTTTNSSTNASSIQTKPIVLLEKRRTVKTGGRPRALKPMPLMEGLSEVEAQLFNDFIKEYLEEYPDITPTDYRMLYLVAVEYIKYLRVAQDELVTNKVLSQARQHPGTRMQALQEALAITRKQRQHGKPAEDDAVRELREVLHQVGRRG